MKKMLITIVNGDENGKPILELTPMQHTVIHLKRKQTAKTILRVFECGGWTWPSRELPTSDYDFWDEYRNQTCVQAGYTINHEGIQKGKFRFGNRDFYFNNSNIIFPKEFYEIQKITLDSIKQINEWFNFYNL